MIRGVRRAGSDSVGSDLKTFERGLQKTCNR
jgi:hypothetical protein